MKVACIGMGWWSDVLADAIKRSGKLTIAACYSRSEDKRQKFASKYGCRAARTFEEILDDRAIEAVYGASDLTLSIASGQLAIVHETATSGWWAAQGCGGFLGAPFFVDAQHGWIGLQRGVGGLSGSNAAGLIATVDGGATWSCVDGLPSEDVSSVWFADASHGWVTTRSDFSGAGRGLARIWRTEDGGRTWKVALA